MPVITIGAEKIKYPKNTQLLNIAWHESGRVQEVQFRFDADDELNVDVSAADTQRIGFAPNPTEEECDEDE